MGARAASPATKRKHYSIIAPHFTARLSPAGAKRRKQHITPIVDAVGKSSTTINTTNKKMGLESAFPLSYLCTRRPRILRRRCLPFTIMIAHESISVVRIFTRSAERCARVGHSARPRQSTALSGGGRPGGGRGPSGRGARRSSGGRRRSSDRSCSARPRASTCSRFAAPAALKVSQESAAGAAGARRRRAQQGGCQDHHPDRRARPG